MLFLYTVFWPVFFKILPAAQSFRPKSVFVVLWESSKIQFGWPKKSWQSLSTSRENPSSSSASISKFQSHLQENVRSYPTRRQYFDQSTIWNQNMNFNHPCEDSKQTTNTKIQSYNSQTLLVTSANARSIETPIRVRKMQRWTCPPAMATVETNTPHPTSTCNTFNGAGTKSGNIICFLIKIWWGKTWDMHKRAFQALKRTRGNFYITHHSSLCNYKRN